MRWTPKRVRKFILETGEWPEIRAGDTISFRYGNWGHTRRSTGKVQRDLTAAEVIAFGSSGPSIDTTPPTKWQTGLAVLGTFILFLGVPIIVAILLY